jgi:hypothetical protein
VAKKNKKNKKLPSPVRAALERGDIVPESALKGKKVPRRVKNAFMKAAMEKAAAPPLIDPVYMARKGDFYPYRTTPGSVHTAIDALMAEAAAVNRREAAQAREREEKIRQEAQPNWYGDHSVVRSAPLVNVNRGV